jgi:hypothetical protein
MKCKQKSAWELRGTVQVESIQIKWFSGQSGIEAGPHERWTKMLKTKLAQGEPSGLSPLKSDGSHDGQREAGPR